VVSNKPLNILHSIRTEHLVRTLRALILASLSWTAYRSCSMSSKSSGLESRLAYLSSASSRLKEHHIETLYNH